MNQWHTLNKEINESKTKIYQNMDKVDEGDKQKIVERCELFRKKYEKMLKAAQLGKCGEILETKGKDIEKYQTKVQLFLGFIVDTKIGRNF